ncbi:UNVERIFIED_CONTAM: hypothetical protein FKN15_013853 [Acipenser sinensis]
MGTGVPRVRAGASATEAGVAGTPVRLACARARGASSGTGAACSGEKAGSTGAAAVGGRGAAAVRARGGGAAGAAAIRGRGANVPSSTTAPTSTPAKQSGAGGYGPLPRARGHPAGMLGPPCARPSAQVGAPPGTVAHLVPCSTPPETSDVTTRSCDVTGVPPSSRCVPPGVSEVAAPVPWLTPLPVAAPSRVPAYASVAPGKPFGSLLAGSGSLP